MKTAAKILLLLMAMTFTATADQFGDFWYSTDGSTATITNYTGLDNAVIIPNTINSLPVTTIGYHAFYQKSKVSSVTISSGILSIGDYSFVGCTLNNISIPNSVTNIGSAAFSFCISLGGITIPSSVVSIGGGAFIRCYSLTSVTIPGSVTNIGNDLFYYCPGLASVTFGQGSTSIGDSTFYACSGLTNVTIPDSVKSIGSWTFENCIALSTVLISSNITSIGYSAFYGCQNLTNLSVSPQNQFYSSFGGALFDKSQSILIQLPCSQNGSFTFPSSVTTIGDGAFSACYGLSGLTIPKGVTSIGSNAFNLCIGLTSVTILGNITNLGSYAFAQCDSLGSVYFKGDAPTADSSLFSGFSSSAATVYYLPGASGWTNTFAAVPAVLWNPAINNFGVRSNQFGFSITGTTNIPIVVEAAPALTGGAWTPLLTATVTNGSIYFSDAAWTNQPTRCYRLRSP